MEAVNTGLPWIPAAQPTPRYNFRNPPPRQVVVHSTETDLQPGIALSLARTWFGTNAAGTSAHDMFDPSSGVEMVHTDNIAWHCGNGNDTSIGIEHAGRASFTKEQWTSSQALAMLRQSAKLTAKICAAYNIPARWLSIAQLAANEPGLCSHNDERLARGGTTHTDPGPNFPYAQYLSYVQQYLAGGSPDQDWFDTVDENTFNTKYWKPLNDKVDALQAKVNGFGGNPEHTAQTENWIMTTGDRYKDVKSGNNKFAGGFSSIQRMIADAVQPLIPPTSPQIDVTALAQALTGVLAPALLELLSGADAKTFRDSLANNVWNTFGLATTDVPHKLRRTDAYLRKVIGEVLDEKLAALQQPTTPPESDTTTGA